MSDAVDRGITVTELATMDQSIDLPPETTVAFVGRALRGPLNTPVLVENFGDFRRRFGDVWSRSSLGPAVQQFFDHGGRRLYVVRVANNARGAMLCLPANGTALVLRGLQPGSTETIRAAVDYDGISAENHRTENDELFNLTLQRIDPETGFVVDQELYRKLQIREGSDAFVGDVLLSSSLVRVEQPYPAHRPEATGSSGSSLRPKYVEPTQPGTDGIELSDYDLIGSRQEGHGLFALEAIERFDLLYLPPPGKSTEIGPAAVLAAELYCRRRGAILIIDPPADWHTPEDAVRGLRAKGLASPNVASYFPRVWQRGDETAAARVVGGAFAGLLCKLDRTYGSWHSLDRQGLGLKRTLRPSRELDDEAIRILTREGINVIVPGPAGRARVAGSMTLARGSESDSSFGKLSVRRTCLRIVTSIDHATRWAVFKEPDSRLADHIRAQVHAFLVALFDLGAFVDDGIGVQCDVLDSPGDDARLRGIRIVVAFQPLGCTAPISFTLNQSVGGCTVTGTAFAHVMENG